MAVIGSGLRACGSSAAERAGHNVVVFEKADRISGILRYGIPDFKLEGGARPQARPVDEGRD